MYRVDRLRVVTLTQHAGLAFDGFDPSTTWQALVHDIEGLRSNVHAELIVDESTTHPILSAFGIQATMVSREADGRSRKPTANDVHRPIVPGQEEGPTRILNPSKTLQTQTPAQLGFGGPVG